MGIRYECDRCGENNPPYLVIQLDITDHILHDDERKYLCSDCYKTLKDWFETKDKNNNNNDDDNNNNIWPQIMKR